MFLMVSCRVHIFCILVWIIYWFATLLYIFFLTLSFTFGVNHLLELCMNWIILSLLPIVFLVDHGLNPQLIHLLPTSFLVLWLPPKKPASSTQNLFFPLSSVPTPLTCHVELSRASGTQTNVFWFAYERKGTLIQGQWYVHILSLLISMCSLYRSIGTCTCQPLNSLHYPESPKVSTCTYYSNLEAASE